RAEGRRRARGGPGRTGRAGTEGGHEVEGLTRQGGGDEGGHALARVRGLRRGARGGRGEQAREGDGGGHDGGTGQPAPAGGGRRAVGDGCSHVVLPVGRGNGVRRWTRRALEARTRRCAAGALVRRVPPRR